MEYTATQIAALVGGTIIGNAQATVSSFAKIEEATEGTLTFLANPQYASYLYTTQASIVLINADMVPSEPVSPTLIRCADAYDSLMRLMAIYQDAQQRTSGISSLAYVSDTATIGNRVTIAPFAYIGDHVVIGDDTIIYPHVCIYQGCQVGARCILHAGCVIGADGFGFAPHDEGYKKIPQIGIVIIDDDVEIGANTCIDRSTMGETHIGKGVKLDNLVQIAHNVTVGAHTVMSAQTGIAGSTHIGEWCMLGGQTGVAGHINVGNHVQVGGHSAITGSIRPEKVLFGYPAIDHHKFARCNAVFRNLPEMQETLLTLQREIASLQQQVKDLKGE